MGAGITVTQEHKKLIYRKKDKIISIGPEAGKFVDLIMGAQEGFLFYFVSYIQLVRQGEKTKEVDYDMDYEIQAQIRRELEWWTTKR